MPFPIPFDKTQHIRSLKYEKQHFAFYSDVCSVIVLGAYQYSLLSVIKCLQSKPKN